MGQAGSYLLPNIEDFIENKSLQANIKIKNKTKKIMKIKHKKTRKYYLHK